MKKKPGRNDPCPCGSQKKFKKCCERKMLGKKFLATKVSPSNGNLSQFFQNNVAAVKPLSERKITITSSPQNPVSPPINTDQKNSSSNDLNKDS